MNKNKIPKKINNRVSAKQKLFHILEHLIHLNHLDDSYGLKIRKTKHFLEYVEISKEILLINELVREAITK